jgi:outer membrane biosynthesis protein TonB
MASKDVFELPEDELDIDIPEEKPTKKKRQLTQTQKEVLKERLKRAREAKKAKAEKKKEEPDSKQKPEVFDTGVKVESGKTSNEYNDDIKMLRDELKNLRRENEKMRQKDRDWETF